jgi:hypothetical protein
MKVVKFKAPYAPYNPGETAGFSDEDADNLVKRGIADSTDITPFIAPRSPEQDPTTLTPTEALSRVRSRA